MGNGSHPKDIVALLLEAATVKNQAFECVLAVAGKPSLIQGVARKVRFSPRSKEDFKEVAHADFLKILPADCVLVSCAVDADSPDAAAKHAVRQLRDATDVFNFYSNSFALCVEPVALIIDLSTGSTGCVQLCALAEPDHVSRLNYLARSRVNVVRP